MWMEIAMIPLAKPLFDDAETSAVNEVLVPLTKGKCAIIDEDMMDKISKLKWQVRDPGINVSNRTLYAVHNYSMNGEKKAIRMHRMIYELKTGENINGWIIDHINHNGLDNRICNLRAVHHHQNIANQKRIQHGYKGVRWNKSNANWNAYIKVNYTRIHLGVFDDEWEAAKAYNSAAIEYFGECASLNEMRQ